jgi:hypothetical protein
MPLERRSTLVSPGSSYQCKSQKARRRLLKGGRFGERLRLLPSRAAKCGKPKACKYSQVRSLRKTFSLGSGTAFTARKKTYCAPNCAPSRTGSTSDREWRFLTGSSRAVTGTQCASVYWMSKPNLANPGSFGSDMGNEFLKRARRVPSLRTILKLIREMLALCVMLRRHWWVGLRSACLSVAGASYQASGHGKRLESDCSGLKVVRNVEHLVSDRGSR